MVIVIIREDTAIPSIGKKAGKRGLCGTILVHITGKKGSDVKINVVLI